jgi:phage protein D
MSGIATSTAILIAAGVGAATTGAELGYQMSQGGGPSAPSAQTTNQQQAEAASAAAQAQAEALQKRRGMASTQLTSPMGTTGTANVGKATLG